MGLEVFRNRERWRRGIRGVVVIRRMRGDVLFVLFGCGGGFFREGVLFGYGLLLRTGKWNLLSRYGWFK